MSRKSGTTQCSYYRLIIFLIDIFLNQWYQFLVDPSPMPKEIKSSWCSAWINLVIICWVFDQKSDTIIWSFISAMYFDQSGGLYCFFFFLADFGIDQPSVIQSKKTIIYHWKFFTEFDETWSRLKQGANKDSLKVKKEINRSGHLDITTTHIHDVILVKL